MDSLYQHSIRIIKAGQAKSGAYVASPNFKTYQYCWLRDGSFIANAMDCAGEFESAVAFFRWVGRTICRYGEKVGEVQRHLESGLPIRKDDGLHTRYSLEGEEVAGDILWGNFQIDGYGTWLWALAEHIRLCGDPSLLNELVDSIQITLRYLELVWNLPNYDCWEEHPEFLHPYSLAAVYAGFNAIESLVQVGHLQTSQVPEANMAARVRDFILNYAVQDGHLVKHVFPGEANKCPRPVTTSGVDSSLIGVTVPFEILPLDDPVSIATIESIVANLHRIDGGVYRYKADVYYGGGEWLLLTAWLGWYYARIRKLDQARELKQWIESKAQTDGTLAEQVNDNPLAPDHYQPWLEKWGPVASPLLWSHAMYIILVTAIEEASR